jgi:hypothetical protein
MVLHYSLQVVDTPGLFDEISDDADEHEKEDILKQILECIVFTLPGPHVFVLVLRGDERFSNAEAKVVSKIKELFSDDISRYLIVLFTHVEDEENMRLKLQDGPAFLPVHELRLSSAFHQQQKA